MKTRKSKRELIDLLENPAFQNSILHPSKLVSIKGGCDDDEDESTAVVLDNGSGMMR